MKSFISRLDGFRMMVDRAKLLKRRGVVVTRRDLEEVVALIDAATAVCVAEEDPEMTADLRRALLPFNELIDPN